jgi:membrane protein implicated in regulation of membrane protease activity
MLCILFAASASGPDAEAASSLAHWLIAAGILVSCGLAIAAGFCSFFPPLAWMALALLCLNSTRAWASPLPVRVAFLAGVFASVVMLAIQAWRVRTGRFVPTIGEDNQPSAS